MPYYRAAVVFKGLPLKLPESCAEHPLASDSDKTKNKRWRAFRASKQMQYRTSAIHARIIDSASCGSMQNEKQHVFGITSEQSLTFGSGAQADQEHM
jgi:hypothetical protein